MNLSPDPLPPAQVRQLTDSSAYKFLRGLVRLWATLFFRKVRLLGARRLTDAGPAVLLINHPASFLDALILVAAWERHVHCLLDRGLLRGVWRGLFARGLNMIPCSMAAEGWRQSLEAGCDVLTQGGVVLIFAEQRAVSPGEPWRLALAAATIALEAEARKSNQLGLAIFPVHLFLPVAQLQSSELLIHVDGPVLTREFLSRGASAGSERAKTLSSALEAACGKNVFGLQPSDVRLFLSDIEEVLRVDLEEDFASRPNWKQKAEGFELSRFVAECAEKLNGSNPGRLVALRESLDAYREAQRRSSLARLEAETAGDWVNSAGWRIEGWFESAVGFPVAAFGLLNHLLAGILLYSTGLMKIERGREQTSRWFARILVTLVCYALQILLCAHWLGRAAAGYYTVLLPLSGAYLWRYGWLLRRRTRLLLRAALGPRKAARLARMRKEFVAEVDAARDAYAELLGLAH